VLSDIEEEIFQNVMRKEEEAKKMSDQLIQHVQQFERAEIEQKQEQKFEYLCSVQMILPDFLKGDA
jgi:polyhydroxyalkanoate synthesis regulator phasin